jgi:LuxR family transcriptional regulator
LYAGTAIEHLSMLMRADCIEEAWATTVASYRALGIAEVIYGYSPDARGAVLGSADDFLILSTLHRDRIRELVVRGFHTQSVTFNWALRNAGVASWSMPVEEAGMPAGFVQRPEAQAFYAANGIVAGVSVGFASMRTRGAAAMALIAPQGVSQPEVDAWLPAVREALFLIGSVAHRALSGLPWTRPNGDLTDRQREVLEWVAEGKTTADIALILGLKPATVEKHLRLARQCLAVDTTAHALVKATFLNQVFVRGNPGAGVE